MLRVASVVKSGPYKILRSSSFPNVTSTAARGVAASSHRNGVPSHWETIPMGPPDPILGLTESFKNDKDERKARRSYGYEFCSIIHEGI